jgi:hypothetical protein
MGDYTSGELAKLFQAQQKDQHNRLASASPELLDALAEYGLIEPQQAFAMKQMAQADKMRDTPMPEGITVRGQYIAPSVLGVAASTIDRIRGGQDSEKEKQAIMAGFMRKMQSNRTIGQNEQDYARKQVLADQAQSAYAATPADVAGPGTGHSPMPSSMKSPGQDFLADLVNPEKYYPGVAEEAGPAAKKPVGGRIPTIPGQTMSPNPNRPQNPYFGWNDIMNVFGGGK